MTESPILYAVTKVRAGVHPRTDEWVLEADLVENGTSGITTVRTAPTALEVANDFVAEYERQYAFLPDAWSAIGRIQDGKPVDDQYIDMDDAYPDGEPDATTLAGLMDQIVATAVDGNAWPGEHLATIVRARSAVTVNAEIIETGQDEVFGPYRFVEVTHMGLTAWGGEGEMPVEVAWFQLVDGKWVLTDGDGTSFDRLSVLPVIA